MELVPQNSIFTEINQVLLGSRNFEKLARQSVDLLVRRCEKYGVVGAGIFRVDYNSGQLYAQAYASKHQRLVEKVLPNNAFAALNVPLEAEDNLMVKTVVKNQVQTSSRASDFSAGVVPSVLADMVQKLVGVDYSMALPVRTPNGKIAGAILLAFDRGALGSKQLEIFEVFTEQLGLAFANVAEFEKIEAKYQTQLKRNSLNTLDEDTIPNIKFTLRLTAKQRENLERLATERGKTQSDIIRQWLDNQ